MLIEIGTQPGAAPIYQQIYEYFKNEIRIGSKKKGEHLPSERELCSMLCVSRSTVNLAYGQLLAEGYIESRPRSGYFVCDIGELLNIGSENIQKETSQPQTSPSYRYDFSPFGVDTSSFPFATWKRLSNKCMSDMDNEMFRIGNAQGDLELRRAIAGYLHSSRGVVCTEEQIVVGAGTDYLLTLLSLILGSGTSVGFENPGYIRSYKIMSQMGLDCIPIPLDKSGMSVCELDKSKAQVCYVTPSHQYPMGIVMPILRRRELLAWAAGAADRYIIEDDHDSEFRYRGKPIPALEGMENSEKVIYLGTFSRAIAPAIRVGYMVLPRKLLEIYYEKCSAFSCTVSRLEQSILTEFISSGSFERHINRMRKLYRSRQEIMVNALKEFDNVTLSGENAGLYILAQVDGAGDEAQLVQRAKESGIRLCGTNQYYIAPAKDTHPAQIMLGFANAPVDKLSEGMKALKEIFAVK